MNMPPSQTARDSEPKATVQTAQPSLEVNQEEQRISLLLPLDSSKLMDDATLKQLQAIDFTPKVEFHVTALDIKKGSVLAELFSRLSPEQQTLLIDSLANTQDQSWQVTPIDEFYTLEKLYDGEELPRRSIIQMVECPELVELYTHLSTLMDGMQFEVPPMHVTLATQGSLRGIGIATASELSRFGTPYPPR